MEMMESYLKAVRRYLPRSQRDDIIAELGDDLREQMEAREEELGRPLDDTEQMAFLTQYGDPMIVARRYRQGKHSLTIGWELIGPELFPMYLMILGLNISIAVGFNVAILLYLHQPLYPWVIFRTGFIQVLVVTLTFTILNLIRRKYPQPWYYPPAELARMMPIAPWVSISGLCVWSVFTLWWTLLPIFPVLLFGSAAKFLVLAPAWHRFYWPVLLLFVAGIAQRATNLARPKWSGLLPITRLLINAIALGLQYPMIKSHPYVLVSAAAANDAHAKQVGATFNGIIQWGVLSWAWVYYLIAVVIYAWYCAPHLRNFLRRRHAAIRMTQEINGIL